MTPQEILQEVRKETDTIMLFHSLGGKDSNALLNMAYPMFKQIHCVYMYMCPNLEHMNRYFDFFNKNYPNVTWHQIEHFAISSYRKYGLNGMNIVPKTTINSLAKIMLKMQAKLKIDWIINGSKQNDGMSRRLQLRTYEHNAINYKNTKAYPLSEWTNKKVMQYIKDNNLLEPINYGNTRQSQSNDITDPYFLKWCKINWPNDFRKLQERFPICEIILFRHENKAK